jgi:hypothetical protein
LQQVGQSHSLAFSPAPHVTHLQWYHDKPEAPPPWSCRTGMSVFLPIFSVTDNVTAAPFSLTFHRKEFTGKVRCQINLCLLSEPQVCGGRLRGTPMAMHGDDSAQELHFFQARENPRSLLGHTSRLLTPSSMHVCCAMQEALNVVTLQPRTLAQVLDERRLSLLLDGRGIVLEASTVSASLFGFDPAALVSRQLEIRQHSFVRGPQLYPTLYSARRKEDSSCQCSACCKTVSIRNCVP